MSQRIKPRPPSKARVGPSYAIEIPENQLEMTASFELRCTFRVSKTHRKRYAARSVAELSTKQKSRGHNRQADLSKPGIA